jgi:hypothetical protein
MNAADLSMGSPYPALISSVTLNTRSAQHLRACKRDTTKISAVSPYHLDYESAQHEYDDEGFQLQ